MKKKPEHGKPGRCARCGVLCLLTAKRQMFGGGKVSKGCFKIAGFPVDSVAAFLAKVITK